MISNDYPTPYGRWAAPPKRPSFWGAPPPSPMPSKPQVMEEGLKAGSVQIERKIFTLSLKENVRGRLLRITEDNGGRYNSIIVPATGLAEFKKMLDEMIAANEKAVPAKATE